MAKKILLTSVLIVWAALGVAQQGRPSWVSQLPEPGNSTYYYRVTMAEARTHDKAYAKAFAMAILESSWKLGVAVDTKDDMKTVEDGILDNISVQQTEMVIPINKVCEFEEQLNSSMNVRVYVLWQVASEGNRKPEFDTFNNCK